ncbi:MAG: hypothetical protein CFE22_10330 [Cytophagaceae bacterium BCCC1]|nr:MAG: hypothetical protein CFE22_10330 [Cytophagaceae bacterium BCCC1]
MFGKKIGVLPVSAEHFLTPEKSKPDYIWVRPRWYYLYVTNLAKLGHVSNVLVTSFQPRIATFSVKNVIFSKILRLNKIQLISLNLSKCQF